MKLCSSIIALLLSTIGYAQLDLGISGRLNYSNLLFKEISSPAIVKISGEPSAGFSGGVFLRANILQLYLQSEFVFTQLNSQIVVDDALGNSYSYMNKLNRFDIPILIGIKLGKFTISAGPVANFNLNSGSEIFKDNYNQGSWAVQGGIGYTFGKFCLSVRYEDAISPFADQVKIRIGQEFFPFEIESRNAQAILCLGYQLN